MAIAFDTSGSTVLTSGVTTLNVDITTAATGAWCYVWIDLPTATTVPTNASWTQLVTTVDTVLTIQYVVCRRQKQAGDTTFAFTWTTAAKGVAAWASYTGLNSSTPDEGAAITFNGSTARTAVPTPSATPTSNDRWAVGFFGVRTSTSTNKPITWTPDAAQTERIDIDNNAAASAAWSGVEIADTASAVTQASHSYTATHNFSEGHDGSAILFLIPAPAAIITGGQSLIIPQSVKRASLW